MSSAECRMPGRPEMQNRGASRAACTAYDKVSSMALFEGNICRMGLRNPIGPRLSEKGRFVRRFEIQNRGASEAAWRAYNRVHLMTLFEDSTCKKALRCRNRRGHAQSCQRYTTRSYQGCFQTESRDAPKQSKAAPSVRVHSFNDYRKSSLKLQKLSTFHC
jgi:hypothetical protein